MSGCRFDCGLTAAPSRRPRRDITLYSGVSLCRRLQSCCCTREWQRRRQVGRAHKLINSRSIGFGRRARARHLIFSSATPAPEEKKAIGLKNVGSDFGGDHLVRPADCAEHDRLSTRLCEPKIFNFFAPSPLSKRPHCQVYTVKESCARSLACETSVAANASQLENSP